MKTVVVRPERCVGCLQCRIGCAVAHSRSESLGGALGEEQPAPARIAVGAGAHGESFPNRCRHCEPAPCLAACLPKALERDAKTGSVLVAPARCIRCGSCAMACPFGVIRFQPDPHSDALRSVALKCDNCIERQRRHEIPACVEWCKTGALRFEEINEALGRKSREVARRSAGGLEDEELEGFGPMQTLQAFKAAMRR